MRFAFAKSSLRDSQPSGAQNDKAITRESKRAQQPVSLVVCSKNEAQNLRANIPKWLTQDYPEFQLILINDASTDGTKEVIEDFAQKDARITMVHVENNEAFWGNKKYALTLGIKTAKHKLLLFTDADCVPSSPQWMAHMAGHFTMQKELVLGYSAYRKITGSFLNLIIRFETVFTALQYFGYAKWGRAYMGVGRNLAYTTDLFYEQSGFINHMDVRSGDDDLFVNAASTLKNTALCCHKDAFTLSEPKTTFAAWSIQKRRHVSVAGKYKKRDRFWLGLFYGSQLLFLILGAVMLISQWLWPVVIAVIVGRYLINWLVVGRLALKLNEKDVAFFYPFLELFLIIFQLSIFSSNLIAKPRRWK